jgi:hypothetical protein
LEEAGDFQVFHESRFTLELSTKTRRTEGHEVEGIIG